MQKKEIILQAPRSFIIFFVQYMAIVPFGAVFGFTLLPFLSKSYSNINDIIILVLLIVFFLVIGIALLYFSQKQRSICIYDNKNNILKKVRKNKTILTCDLNSINEIILKISKEYIGVNIKLLLEKTEDNCFELYCEQNYLGYKQWISFAKKLAMHTSLPLREDVKGLIT